MEQIIGAFIIAALSSVIGFIIAKKINSAKYDIYIEQAKAQATVIEVEAKNLLKDARINAKKRV